MQMEAWGQPGRRSFWFSSFLHFVVYFLAKMSLATFGSLKEFSLHFFIGFFLK